MPAVAALGADADAPGFQGNVVEEHDDVLRWDFIEGHGLLNALAGEVHKRGGLKQQHVFSRNLHGGGQPLELQAVNGGARLLRDAVNGHKAAGVACVFIFGAGIAQPGDNVFYRSRSGSGGFFLKKTANIHGGNPFSGTVPEQSRGTAGTARRHAKEPHIACVGEYAGKTGR